MEEVCKEGLIQRFESICEMGLKRQSCMVPAPWGITAEVEF